MQIIVPSSLLHVAGLDGLNEGLHRVTGRGIFVGNVTVIAGFGNSSHNGGVVNFLVLIKLVTAGDTCGMYVADVFNVLTYCGNQVAFHNLHVVNVVEHFESRRINAPTQLEAPGGFVAHIAGVIDLAVEQLHADIYAVILGNLGGFFEDGIAVVHALLITDSFAVAGHGDNVSPFVFGGVFDVCAEVIEEFGVQRFVVEAFSDASGTSYNRCHEAVFFQRGPVIFADKIYTDQAHFRSHSRHLFDVHSAFTQAAAAYSLFDASLFDHSPRLGVKLPWQDCQCRVCPNKPGRTYEHIATC